jgi:hypothetical protein
VRNPRYPPLIYIFLTGDNPEPEYYSCLIRYIMFDLSLALVGVSATETTGFQSCRLISFFSMSSRRVYTAITPEYANSPTPHSPSGLNPSRIHSWLASAKDVVQRNIGLLLFIASQAFLAFMYLAVKILNTIDPPITALEVCLLSYF